MADMSIWRGCGVGWYGCMLFITVHGMALLAIGTIGSSNINEKNLKNPQVICFKKLHFKKLTLKIVYLTLLRKAILGT